jgi:hypothetical protein
MAIASIQRWNRGWLIYEIAIRRLYLSGLVQLGSRYEAVGSHRFKEERLIVSSWWIRQYVQQYQDYRPKEGAQSWQRISGVKHLNVEIFYKPGFLKHSR